MSTFLLKELTGTESQSFKVGSHKIISEAEVLTVSDNDYGVKLFQVAPALLQVSEQSFYWGNAPLTVGTHNVGDIVWNINKDNPNNILCWRCTESGSPGKWQPQYTDPLQLPKTATLNSVAQYKDGAWAAVAVEDLVISADRVTETVSRKFVTEAQLEIIEDISGTNTGDETRQSIINKLGAAASDRHGYLSSIDFTKLQTAYNIATELVNNPADLNIPVKVSDLIDDVNILTASNLPTRVSQLVNDVGYITADRLPANVSELANDAGYITSNSLPNRVGQLSNDANYITIEDLSTLNLNDIVDVDISSSRLRDGYVLTYKAYLDRWVPHAPDIISSVNNVKADGSNIQLTTTNIPEGTNKYFTPERVTTWAQSYIKTVPLRELEDVDIADNEEGTILYFTDSAWRARRLENITLFSVDNLADVALGDTVNDFEILTFNNGAWSNVSFDSNPKFVFDALGDVDLQDPKEGQVITFDSNNRRWVNRNITVSSNGQTTIDTGLGLTNLVDVSFVNAGLQNGAVLTYNATTGQWSPSSLSAAVTSVNGQSGAVTLTTGNVAESGGNLYFTTQRVDERITQRLANANLTELLGIGGDPVMGSVMYYNGNTWSAGNPSVLQLSASDLTDFLLQDLEPGQVLVNENGYWVGRYISDLLNITTDDVPEGSSNLYYTDSRVQDYITNSATIPGANLIDNSITLAKLPQVAQNQLLARYDAGTGNLQTVTLGTGLSFSGSTLNVSVVGGVTSVVTQTGDVTAVQIATALNALTGASRVSYNSLKDLVYEGGLITVYETSNVLNAVAGRRYLLNGTTSVQLPLGTNGDIIKFIDYAGAFATTPVSIAPTNPDTIAGGPSLELTTNYSYVELTYYGGVWCISAAESFSDLSLVDNTANQVVNVDWGDITGALADQTDLQAVLSSKMNIAIYDADEDGVVDIAANVEGIGTAGNSKYYGTNKSGTAGFYDVGTGEILIELSADVTWYVAPDGDPEADGLTVGTPITLDEAFSKIKRIKVTTATQVTLTLNLTNGTYNNNLPLEYFGLQALSIIINAATWVGSSALPTVIFNNQLRCNTWWYCEINNVHFANGITSILGWVTLSNVATNGGIKVQDTGVIRINNTLTLNYASVGWAFSVYDNGYLFYNPTNIDTNGNSITFSSSFIELISAGEVYINSQAVVTGSISGKKISYYSSNVQVSGNFSVDSLPGTTTDPYPNYLVEPSNTLATTASLATVATSGSYNDLTDVDTTGLNVGQTMIWNGTYWVPGSALSGKMDKSIYDTDDDGVVDIAASVEGIGTAGNSKYYGTDETGIEGFYDLPEGGAGIKGKNIESISATKTLTLTDEYFQFLTPTVASVIVKLPAVTGSDYFECEIVNISTTNALAIQENDGTAIVTLENDNDLARSVYCYWDGTTWQVWIRGYY